jgi:hypothetical protein
MATMDKLTVTSAYSVYGHAKQLLKIAQRCDDDDAADEVTRIAHALLEIAYQEDEVVAIDGEPLTLN